jgi:hypothetical protein
MRKLQSITFNDAGGRRCQLGESSATETSVWFGIIETLEQNRMLLDQKQVKKLLPYLERFVKTGRLRPPKKPK